MVEDVLKEPRRPSGKFFLVDIRWLDLESCCQCGDDTLAHKVNHVSHYDFDVHKHDDYNARPCRHFRALAAREDVILMSTDLYGGALCCRGSCAETCGTPKLARHITYDDFAVGIGQNPGQGHGDDGSGRRFLASFRGGCRRGLWNSSTVRLDAKVATDALADPSLVFDCGGFEVRAIHVHNPVRLRLIGCMMPCLAILSLTRTCASLLFHKGVGAKVWKCCSNFDEDAHEGVGASKAPRRCKVVPCSGGDMGYSALLRASKFGLAPRGAERWSSRLTEVMAYDAIPVVISDGYSLPYAQVGYTRPFFPLLMACALALYFIA